MAKLGKVGKGVVKNIHQAQGIIAAGKSTNKRVKPTYDALSEAADFVLKVTGFRERSDDESQEEKE